MSPRLALALEAAYRAGRFTLAHFNVGVPVERKADRSPVTLADMGAERIIREMLGAAYPGEAILGEEEGGSRTGSSLWVIDPIDGTKSFVCGVPLYATLLSYEEGGEPLVGVCYLPALDEVLYAEKGSGAHWNGRPCRVSDKGSLEGAVICCGSHASLRQAGLDGAFGRLAERATATRTWTDAYGHALVATGRVEAMVDPVLKYWDIPAMMLIVREAGGEFTDLKGGPTPTDQALSSNGRLHGALLEALRS
jgi:histidinol phosphatase-like enzyme (inositol monophosphatase family)